MRLLSGAFSLLWAGRAWAGCDDQTVVRGELITAMILLDVDAKRGIRVVSSPGGTGAAAMVLALVHPLIIDGVCNSSCAWAFVTNQRACFTPRAVFGFHTSHDPGTGQRMPSATSYWLDHVRPGLAARLSGLQSSSTVIRISAAEMGQTYGDRACRQDIIARCSDRAKRVKAGPIRSLWNWPMMLGAPQ
jgi:hypothetical protein